MELDEQQRAAEQQRLVDESEIACAVLGNVAGDFVLVDLSCPLEGLEPYQQRGFFFAGIMGYSCGMSTVRSEPTFEASRVILRASVPFAQLVAGKLGGRQRGSEDWCTRLWQLPDTREN